MYFLSSKTLIKRLRTNDFKDFEVAPYFLASMLLQALSMFSAFSYRDPWNITAGILVLFITYGGIMHVRNKNGGTFGNGYLNKWFTLGWVTAVRTFLIGVPVLITLTLICSSMDRNDGPLAAIAIFNITYNIAFYWWLGALVEETNDYA